MSGTTSILKAVLTWVVLDGFLVAPSWLSAQVGEGVAPGWIVLEAALVAGGFAMLPRRRWTVALAWVASLTVVLITAVAFADAAFRVSLARPFNLVLDAYLLSSVYHLAVGNSGLILTLLAAAGLFLALALLAFALAWLLAPRADLRAGLPRRLTGLALVTLFALGVGGWAPTAWEGQLSLPVVGLVRDQIGDLRTSRDERAAFQRELSAAPLRSADATGLLSGLRDRDVLLTFIESYGMAALDDPEFAAVIGPRLDSLGVSLRDAGLYVATGTFVSPTQGGQSWLAHGTAISGLRLNNQVRYDMLMASGRETLIDDFRHSGHRTVALMPAITMAWPEGLRLGYDEVLTRKDIPYAGPPLFWVTMPDQFTLAFLEDMVRSASDGRPLFVETALVSSHAPWTPTLPLLDWNSIGDGSVFAPYAREGHPPEELWVDIDELRRGYALSLDYSLQVVTGFAERGVDERTLLIVLGDHQAAPWVTGSTDPAVPVHVITGDPALLEPFLKWGFLPGAFPDPHRQATPLEAFRGWLLSAFSDGPA